MKFKSLIAEFGVRYGIGELVPDADGVVGIGVDDRSVTFRRQGESDCVIALAELGDVPEAGADAVNRLLMQVNQALFIEDGLVITRPEKSGRYCLLDRMDVASMDFLGFDRRISRLLAQAEEAEITPIILCNKYDLISQSDAEKRLKEWERIGYRVLRVSARTGEGIPELASILEDKRSVFFGQSGVGKSSVVNVLDSTVVLKTGSLSQKYDRGQHTTTRGNLYHLQLNESLMDGRIGAVAHIIDTPGVRRFVLDGIKADDLILYFKEFLPFVGQCQFGMSCSHTHETGCKVLQAVQNGDISAERFESWQRIKEEIITGSWED